MTNRFLTILAACCTACFAGQSSGEVLFQGEARDTLKISRSNDTGATITEEQQVTFEHLTVYNYELKGPYEIVAKATLTSRRDTGLEGSKSEAKIEFYFPGGADKFPAEPSRTIEVPNVHKVDFRDDYWVATTQGCCGSEDYSRLYSFTAESPFLRFNNKYAKIEVPNTSIRRYVGVVIRSQVANDAADDAIFQGNKTAVAAITYGAPGKAMNALLLEPNIPPGAAKKTGDNTGYNSSLIYSIEGLKVASVSGKDEIYDPGAGDMPVELRMFSLDPLQDGQGNLKTPAGVSGLVITASFQADDGSTETFVARVENDKIIPGEATGKKLRAVVR